MSLTNKILVVVVILALAFTIIFSITASSTGSGVPDVSPIDAKKAEVIQLKDMLNSTLSLAKREGVSLSCQSVTDCLKGLPNTPQSVFDLDSIINRLHKVNQSLNDELNSSCLQGISGARAAYNRLLYQITDKTGSLNVDPMDHPDIFTNDLKICTVESNLRCVKDYANCSSIMKVALDKLSKIPPRPIQPFSPTPSTVPFSPTPSTVPFPQPKYLPPPRLTEEYTAVVEVTDKDSLAKHFLLDDPSGIGADPTGGINNYSYPFNKGPEYKKNPYFQCITKDTPLISDMDSSGIKIDIAPDMTWNWSENSPNKFSLSAGAPRLMTQKFFKGGLFVLDITHAPIGCAIWPALWLNAFVGEKDQFPLQKNQDGYDVSMKKLVNTYQTRETYNPLVCKENESLVNQTTEKPAPENKELSDFAGQKIYVAAWPAGGEIDIFENVSFAKQNQVSIHSGAMCELVGGTNNTWSHDCPACPDEMRNTLNARSTCGVSDMAGFGPYSGCKSDINKMNGEKVAVQGASSNRYSCLGSADLKSDQAGSLDSKDGNAQVLAPDGTFGIGFNKNGGGVYVCEWIPMKEINIWFFSHKAHNNDTLQSSGGPLSKNPNPKNWPKDKETLFATYEIGHDGTLSAGCDFNFMNLIINIAIGGGFGGGTMPEYCKSSSFENNTYYKNLVSKPNGRALQANEYIKHCYNADPNQKGGGKVGPLGNSKNYLPGEPLPSTPLPTNLNCSDGEDEPDRGDDRYFYKSAYYIMDSIRIFQKSEMDSVF